MPVKLRLHSRLTLSTIAVLLSASSAFAGASEDCAAEADYAHGNHDSYEAFRLCGPLAQQGDAKAQFALAFMIGNGEGVKVDLALSAKWLRKAAEQGYARAQSALGYRYLEGSGVPQDYAEATNWYRKSAEQGDAFGQSQLGFMYDLGHGVPQDYVLAHMWFNLAAAHGRADFADYGNMADLMYDQTKMAADMRDEVAKKMTHEQIVEAQRLAREWKPTK
jgi:TPR repeat protein